MARLSIEYDPALWVEVPFDSAISSWPACAAEDMCRARGSGQDELRVLCIITSALQGLPRETDVLYRLALVDGSSHRYWLVDISAGDHRELNSGPPAIGAPEGVPSKHVEQILVGDKFPGLRIYRPNFVPVPGEQVVSEAPSVDVEVPMFVYRFYVTHPDGGALLLTARASHFSLDKLLDGLPLIDELLASVSIEA